MAKGDLIGMKSMKMTPKYGRHMMNDERTDKWNSFGMKMIINYLESDKLCQLWDIKQMNKWYMT